MVCWEGNQLYRFKRGCKHVVGSSNAAILNQHANLLVIIECRVMYSPFLFTRRVRMVKSIARSQRLREYPREHKGRKHQKASNREYNLLVRSNYKHAQGSKKIQHKHNLHAILVKLHIKNISIGATDHKLQAKEVLCMLPTSRSLLKSNKTPSYKLQTCIKRICTYNRLNKQHDSYRVHPHKHQG